MAASLAVSGMSMFTATDATASTGLTDSATTSGITWVFDTIGSPETASITGCVTTATSAQCAGAVVIPSSVTDSSGSVPVTYSVTEIGQQVFLNNTDITSVVIPDTATSIGAQAFSGASALTSVTFGTGVTSIGDSAFFGASALVSVVIPDTVTSIADYAFYGASALTSVTFGTGVTSIGIAAFAINTALTSVTIPAGVTTLSGSAFAGTTSLTTVTLPSSLVTIDWNAFRDSGLTSISIPNSVTTINPNAFMDAFRLASVTFGSGLTSVDSSAFSCSDCAVPYPVTSVVFAPGTTSFDASWVSGMSSLASISIPGSVTSIPDDTFDGKPLTTVTLGTGLLSIGARAFRSTSVTSIDIPATVTSIGDSAFDSAGALTMISFDGAPPTIGADIFLSVPATSVLIPRGAGWPAPPTTFGGIPTEYEFPPAPTPAPAPAPAPVVTPTPTPSPSPTATTIAAPIEGLSPITAPGGGALQSEGVRPGGSVLLVGGQLLPVVVEPEPGPRPAVITASGSGFVASFGGVGGDGTPLPLGPSGALVVQSVQQGRSVGLREVRAAKGAAIRRAHAAAGTGASSVVPVVATSGDGFLSGSTIRFYVLPDTLMGDLVADSAGAFAGDVPVPAGIAPGPRTLQMNGYAPDGSVRSLSIGILVKAAGVDAVSKKRASVYFAPMSAKITAQGMAVLRRLVAAVGTDAAVTRVVGFVLATGSNDNDDSLSTARAAAVKAALRSLGLRGPIDDRGDGAAVQDGPAARRATVTIAYRRRFGRR
jgi:hypothetical protein